MTGPTYRALLLANATFPEDPGDLGDLEGPRHDPGLLREALCDEATGVFPADNVRVATEADSSALRREIDDFLGRATPEEVLLLYYSGHGRDTCTEERVLDHSDEWSEQLDEVRAWRSRRSGPAWRRSRTRASCGCGPWTRGRRVGGVDSVVMDLEASCWEAAWVRSRMETIEIGAVRLGPDLEPVEEYDAFVRPTAFPRLSSFCTKLTSITQDQVDAADTFPKAFARFLTWMGPRARLVTWGAFDIGQLRLDCERHDMVFPEHLAVTHLNLKTAFGKWKGRKRVAMQDALDLLGLPHEGHAHRGIDDARNLARIAQATLPHLPTG